MYINFISPPMPYLIVGGLSIFRKGDKHERRKIHNTFDLIYVRSGTMYMEEEGKHFDVHKGQFLILSPDKVHASYRYCDEDTVFSWIHFYSTGDFSFSDKPAHYIQAKMNKNKYYQKDKFYISIPKYGSMNSKCYRDIEGYLDQISQVKIDKYNQQKLFFNSVSSQIDYQILFMKIIALICESSEKPQERDLAEEIYSFLKHSYTEPFNLTELSHRYAFHPAYIIRCIKMKYGLTPLQLLISIRMEEAKKLLKTTNLHVNIIAQNVGYYDMAYFSKQFKNVTGMTAIEYRRKETGAL
ncbi:helix-turn-helix domain-containing protein [Clostridium oryzae]|uniref:Arabinose operon regulatory protein n=1 Tax=Clostridium oryzae TaxID=1450648 RepID=A0A1V4IIH0_9CLOT|nr:helix-turn-helix domain-containing protein [Clostridium oryzae]OPJ59634.1 arabinose operon regulatory protein [Clostridium oryzae]